MLTGLLGQTAHWVTALLVIILAHVLATLSWSLKGLPSTSPPPPPQLTGGMTVPLLRGPDLAAIEQAHLFGLLDESRPVITAPIQVPETSLRLALRGIIAPDQPNGEGGAIIAEAQGNDRYFRVGDAIAGSAVVKEIQSDQVILSRNNRLETLRLPRERGNSGNSGVGTSSPSPVTLSPKVGEVEGEDSRSSPERMQKIQEMRQRIAENPASLAELIQPQPVYRSGKLEGFRLRPNRQAGNLLGDLGLQHSDVVTSVNGISLDSPVKAMEVLRGLQNAQDLQVTVSRQGRTENVTLHLGP